MSMKRRALLIIGIVAVIGLSGVLILLRQSRGRYYGGKSLAAWTLEAGRRDTNAAAAIRAMGPDAVPALIELLQSSDSGLRKKIWEVQPKLSPALRKKVWEKVPVPDSANIRASA